MAEAAAILERVAAVADELNVASLQPLIETCRRMVGAGDGIDVAVFGRFKAGKSSFLNHLAGRDVLPIGVVPLTAVVTRLRYSEAEQAEVLFSNGRMQRIQLVDIGLYVGENGNPGNGKEVASVEVALPELRRLAPLRFVDTPGLGSAFKHNTEAALKWLPNVGAAVVAVSADAPMSERDLALLEDLRGYTPRIIVLLTKADLLNADQRVEVLEFVRAQLGSRWGAEVSMHFYSVRPEEGRLKAELEREVLEPLIRQRGAAAAEITRHKVLSLVRQTLGYLRVALAAATESERARAALRETLAEERREFGLLRSELQVLTQEWSGRALDFYLERLRPRELTLKARVTEEFERRLGQWHLRLPSLLAAWRTWLGDFLKQELVNVSCEETAMFLEPQRRAGEHLTRMVRAFHGRLAEHVRAALGISLDPAEFTLEAAKPCAPPVDVAYAFDPALEMAAYVMPVTVFRGPIRRVLARKARYEVEKNLSRLAGSWRDRIAAGIRELTRQAEQRALDELTVLETLVAQGKSRAPQLKRTAEDLEEMGFGLQASAGQTR